jgi:ubiquitin C-terminal hydrolase
MPQQHKATKLKGLNNIGNTCFLNATLQCLLSDPLFRTYWTMVISPPIHIHNPKQKKL